MARTMGYVNSGTPFKKGNPEEHGNYRLITLGNTLSKLFSKILCRRLDELWKEEKNWWRFKQDL